MTPLLPQGEAADPLREQAFVREAAALFDRSYRGVVDIAGREAARVLDGVFSSHVTDLSPGRGQLSALLSAKGRLLGAFQLHLLGTDRLRLVFLEPPRESFLAAARKYAFLSDLEVADRTPEVAVVSIEGARAREAVQAACGIPAPADHLQIANARVAGRDVTIVRAGETPEGGFDAWVTRGDLEEVSGVLLEAVRAEGGGFAGEEAAEALRIEAGVARHGLDYDDESFPNDCGWEPALAYDKCYVGQEVVARIRTYGQANRRLRGAVRREGELPRPPCALFVDGEEAGRLTSAARSARLGSWIGLAMVKRKHLEAARGMVEAAGGPVEVELRDLPIVRP